MDFNENKTFSSDSSGGMYYDCIFPNGVFSVSIYTNYKMVIITYMYASVHTNDVQTALLREAWGSLPTLLPL